MTLLNIYEATTNFVMKQEIQRELGSLTKFHPEIHLLCWLWLIVVNFPFCDITNNLLLPHVNENTKIWPNIALQEIEHCC